ncbi:Hypothetical predicted protein [Paramuricea clavata]|uniref:Uncharacterized protein n=1 Tax=Paramuricea clavata TaxID=317549 RepID=A0A6S7GM22_PARCT|nr:Hypothetical predicted protein [Paramuricea clavata]
MAEQDDVAQVLEEEEQSEGEVEENESYEGDDEHVETNDEQEEPEENNVEGEKCSGDEMYIDDLCESDDEKDEKHALSDELFKRKTIIEQATAPNEEEDYVRSHDDVMKSVKNKDDLAGMKIVNFLNKKDKLKGVQKATGQLPKPPDAPNPGSVTPGQRRAQRPGTTVDAANERIMEIFKQEGVSRGGNGNVVHKGMRYNIPYTDLLYDLTHNTTEKTANLTSVESEQAMRLLRKIKMPASHIRSTCLRGQYIKTRTTRVLPETPSTTSEEDSFTSTPFGRPPSRIPQPLRRHTASAPYNRRSRTAHYTPYQQLDRQIRDLLH